MDTETINVYQAKAQFSRLLDLAAHGTETIIAKAGRPVAKLVPWEPEVRRQPGIWAGQIRIADDFDTLSTEDEHDWYSDA